MLSSWIVSDDVNKAVVLCLLGVVITGNTALEALDDYWPVWRSTQLVPGRVFQKIVVEGKCFVVRES